MTCCNIILKVLVCLCTICLLSLSLQAQTDSAALKPPAVIDISNKTIDGLQKQYGALQSKLEKESSRLLNKLQRSENKLQSKLPDKDSAQAKELFTDDIKQRYSALKDKLTNTTKTFNRFPLKEYLPGVDSMQTALSFLLKNKTLPADKLNQLQGLSSRLKGLQGQLQNANEIESFVRQREAAIKEHLLNSGFARQLTGINKKVYYYQTQLSQYKEMLNDKDKLKDKLLSTVRTLPAFQKYWQRYSYVALMFPQQGNLSTPQALAGLQTKTGIQNLIAQKIGTGASAGVNPQQLFQQQVGAAQAQLSQLKDKLTALGTNSGSSDMTMPDFEPNNQKSKSFLKRLQYGFNVQNTPSRYYLPTTSDFALTLGYKISDNKIIGLGAGYKIGWGNGIKDIHLSSQGVGLRSYLDIKAKGSIWVSGGFEYNYYSTFKSFQELKDNVNVWQKSALLGLTKKYTVGKKEGNMQLLYDFLHQQQTPPETAFKFRVGYIF